MQMWRRWGDGGDDGGNNGDNDRDNDGVMKKGLKGSLETR